ncbi:MAG: TIGR00730 family Rossman fold protein [Candidatus Kapabacteria bacterium]|nr:TIGR00730 family Rossman fold protein [Candidatus Kapabacteria bacterium]
MNICIYCGSRSGTDPIFEDVARCVAGEILRRGWNLVYGGGGIGLMDIVARSVFEGGGHVTGIIPSFLATREVALWECSELIEVPSMHVRKQMMIERSDALVALPGGFGTMDELFEAITWRQLKLHDRPIGLVNAAGYFDPLLAMNSHMVERGFVEQRHADILMSDDDVARLFDALEANRGVMTTDLTGRT